MARGVDEHQRDVSNGQVLAVGDLMMRVAELRARSAKRPGPDRDELTRTTGEVRVNMRFDRIREAQALRVRRLDVNVHVTPRVDYDRFASAWAGEEKRRLRQPFVEEPLQHDA